MVLSYPENCSYKRCLRKKDSRSIVFYKLNVKWRLTKTSTYQNRLLLAASVWNLNNKQSRFQTELREKIWRSERKGETNTVFCNIHVQAPYHSTKHILWYKITSIITFEGINTRDSNKTITYIADNAQNHFRSDKQKNYVAIAYLWCYVLLLPHSSNWTTYYMFLLLNAFNSIRF